jgi:hypothetical protein
MAADVHKQLVHIATTHGINLAKVARVAKLLGHTDEQKIVEYIRQSGFAVVRNVSDGKGGFRRQTEEEFADKFK